MAKRSAFKAGAGPDGSAPTTPLPDLGNSLDSSPNPFAENWDSAPSIDAQRRRSVKRQNDTLWVTPMMNRK